LHSLSCRDEIAEEPQRHKRFSGETGGGRSWQGSCSLGLATMTPLNPSGHLSKSEAAVRPRPKSRAKPARRRAKAPTTPGDEAIRPAVGTLSRTKSLLLAALKVWELKNGIRD
jgi:hypothetical protein